MEDFKQIPEPDRTIGRILIEFYDCMKELEKETSGGQKQSVKIIMTIHEIKKLQEQNHEKATDQPKRNDSDNCRG